MTAHPESPLSEERVREYEQMLSAVTPGPWEVAGANDRECHAEGDILAPNIQPTRGLDRRVLAQLNHWYPSSADARFIAASPTIVRDLLDGYRALSERVAELEAEPTRIDQTPDGCWVACVAGLTGLPHDTLARFVPRLPDGSCDGSMGTEYHNAVNAYLRANGWRLYRLGSDAPRGFAIGGGMSPRGVSHAVIVRDGALWHDPHPSRAGIEDITSYEVVVQLARPVADAFERMRTTAPDCYAYTMAALKNSTPEVPTHV